MLNIDDLFKLIYEGKLCPYCGAETIYVDSTAVYSKSYGMIYLCTPCDAYVGVHKGTANAKGRLANAELRFWKKEAHAYFDPIWQVELNKGGTKYAIRNKAYDWLSKELGIHREITHIGFFDIYLCKQSVEICKKVELETIESTTTKVKSDMPRPEIESPDFLSVRDNRTIAFLDDWLPKFEEKFGDDFVYDKKKFCFTLKVINDRSEIDVFDFYPKANKVLFRKENRWIKPGLNWLINTFLHL